MPANIEMGKLHLERGNTQAAIEVFMQALTENFTDTDSMAHVASCFLQISQFGIAANLLARCAEQKPSAQILNNLATCYRRTNQIEAAEEIFRMALNAADTDRLRGEITTNLAGCYGNNGTPEKAIELYKAAERFLPDELTIKFNHGLVELENGNWADGFALYDLGLYSGNRQNRVYKGIKQFKPTGDAAEDLAQLRGKTVIVWGDQGIGDEIMFASCIPDLMSDAKRVIFDCHPRLVRLFETSLGIECHGTRKTQLGEWHFDSDADVSICISTLAMLYRHDGAFPGNAYLKAKAAHTPGRLPKVGIAWTGGTPENRSDLRSLSLDQLQPLLSVPGIDWYSLEYRDAVIKDICKLEEKTGIHIKHFPESVQAEDYGRTAEFVAGLDLVISACTSVIHLAGALGKPCWVMTPSKPAWRYGCHGNRMPWYSSNILYRQIDGDWAGVVTRLRNDLSAQFLQQAAE